MYRSYGVGEAELYVPSSGCHGDRHLERAATAD